MDRVELVGDWPASLKVASDIASYIEENSSEYVDVEFAEEYFRGAAAILKWVPMDSITPGDGNTNVRNAENEAAFAELPLQTMPPIVIEGGVVMDGNHRHRVALAKGAPGMWAYVVVDEMDLSKELAEIGAEASVECGPPSKPVGASIGL